MEVRDKIKNETESLRLLPAHVIPLDDGIVVKRGRLEIRIDGKEAAVVLDVIAEETAQGGATAQSISERFATKDRQPVLDLLSYLKERRIIVPEHAEGDNHALHESSQQIYYWHFGRDFGEVSKTLSEVKIAIIGINFITRQLIRSLSASGYQQFKIYDEPDLRNVDFFDMQGELLTEKWGAGNSTAKVEIDQSDHQHINAHDVDCVIASSDYGSQHALRKWNELCVAEGIRFLPILLKDLIGQVGPFVIPGETACLECLRIRQNSHMENPAAQRKVEHAGSAIQKITGFHPAMASILGDVAVMELTKFYAQTPKWHVNSVVEVNLLTSTMKPRNILKLPGCPVCSNLYRRSSSTAAQFVFLPGNRV